ncbi:MAG: DUF4842 domain-containing protein [Phocaeicola sp.]
MKKMIFLFSILLSLFLASCTDNNDVVKEVTDEPTESEAQVRYISIFADQECKLPIVQNYPLKGNDNSVQFALAYGLDEVYVKSISAAGEKVEKMLITEVANSSRSSDPGTQNYFDRFENIRFVNLNYDGEATPGYQTMDAGFVFYHCSGVVMFEDTWPSKSNVDGLGSTDGLFFSDYNDLVVDFDLESVVNYQEEVDQYWKEDLKVVLHIRARGGEYAKRLGLKLHGVTKDIVEEDVDIVYSMSNHEEPVRPLPAEVKWDAEDGCAIIYINDLANLVNPTFMAANGLEISEQNGLKYYNTVYDWKNSGKGLFTVNVIFHPKDHETAMEYFPNLVMNSRNHNFFIVTQKAGKTYHTHLAGYEPTSDYLTYEADKNDKADGVLVPKSADAKYLAADGNVWGFKTPVLVKHAVERSNFSMAFPKFINWVSNGRSEYSQWYSDGVYEMHGQYLIMPW